MSKKNITVLGIHLWHDSGASIVRNGKVCTAINENKIINVKNASGYISRILLKYEIIFRYSLKLKIKDLEFLKDSIIDGVIKKKSSKIFIDSS